MTKIKLIGNDNEYPHDTIVDGTYKGTNYHGLPKYSYLAPDGCQSTVWIVSDETNPTNETFAGVIVSDEQLVSAVEHPTHYNAVEGMPEVWDILDAFFPDDPLLWNAAKYLLRAGRKDDNAKVQDLGKLLQYVQRRIEKEDNE